MTSPANVAVIGAGPAGLMAAQVLSASGVDVTVYERMPSVGRKLLMAGRGGLNLTHSEPLVAFAGRYGTAAPKVAHWLEAFSPADLVAWANDLGQETFVGSSGRVFPKAMKASPLLRAWLARLAGQGVSLQTGWTWRGWDGDGHLRFEAADSVRAVQADAVILAMGGASWPRLGSDGRWAPVLASRGVALSPFQPSNCGFHVAWSPIFRERFAGSPLKGLALAFEGRTVRGEAMIADYGLEGGAIYAHSAALRDAVLRDGQAKLIIDLRPGMSAEQLAQKLTAPAGASMANRLRKAGLSPVETNLLREGAGLDLPKGGAELAGLIKHLTLTLTAPTGLERAISSAGGVSLDALDDQLMLRAAPGVFAAGEMVDWEAPTGGYLLQASFASGVVAARGVMAWLGRQPV